jgi:hypothetical protein
MNAFVLNRIAIMPTQLGPGATAKWSSSLLFSHYGIKYGNIPHCTNHIMKMETPEPAKTSIQVIERMVALLDVLASYPDPVSLKELS